jgi:hypothetical protein
VRYFIDDVRDADRLRCALDGSASSRLRRH